MQRDFLVTYYQFYSGTSSAVTRAFGHTAGGNSQNHIHFSLQDDFIICLGLWRKNLDPAVGFNFCVHKKIKRVDYRIGFFQNAVDIIKAIGMPLSVLFSEKVPKNLSNLTRKKNRDRIQTIKKQG